MERGHEGWTVGWKTSRVEARQGGGSEAEQEGGSEADRTKEERKEGGANRAEEGRDGRPFEPGAAFEFQLDFKTIQVWSKT